MRDNTEFAGMVEQFYEPLYRFAYSLTRSEADACDLTQHAFLVLAQKGDQIRDPAKVRTWLFTTLHRKFLERCRHETRFRHQEIDSVSEELPVLTPPHGEQMDAEEVVAALLQLDEIFRAPVALFYLEDHSYPEIAGILEIPLGTVKSRIARGVRHLQALMNVEKKTDNTPRQ
jgi:RNA polymerase sigma-70 factor, ECF subfamily